jgi:hypothetical protein
VAAVISGGPCQDSGGRSPAPLRRATGSIPGHAKWDLW